MHGSADIEPGKHLYNTLDNTPLKFKQKIKDIKMKNKLLNSLNNTNVDIAPNDQHHLTNISNEGVHHDNLSNSIDDGQVQTAR